MFCDEVLDSIEAIAAGDLVPEGRIEHHLRTCRLCAAALESARQVERLLKARAAPKPPSNFTPRTMNRVRRARWRSEQFLDAGFNAALGLVLLGIAGAAWAVVNRSGLSSVSSDAVVLFFSTGIAAVVRRVAPALPMYGAATVLVGAALGLWWWAERSATS